MRSLLNVLVETHQKELEKQATTYVNKVAEMVKQVEYYSGKIIQR